MDCSYLEKPALVMNINDFANGLNFARLRSKEISKTLCQKGLCGKVTAQMVHRLKADTFNTIGTLTIRGLINIFEDLRRAGLPNHTSVKNYMSSCITT